MKATLKGRVTKVAQFQRKDGKALFISNIFDGEDVVRVAGDTPAGQPETEIAVEVRVSNDKHEKATGPRVWLLGAAA